MDDAALTDTPDWPLFGLIDDVRPALGRAQAAGQAIVLATLFATEGGSPRGVGAQMLIGADGPLVGYLSGGCIEGDVAAQARAVLAGDGPKHLAYGRGGPLDLPLPCGGRIEVLIEGLRPDDPVAAEWVRAEADRRAVLWLSNGVARACIGVDEALPDEFAGLEVGVAQAGWRASPFALYRRSEPLPRLVVVGTDPTALAIAKLGAEAGYETWLNLPFGPAEGPFPDLIYSREEPAALLTRIGLDRWTAVVAATHDSELDQAALVAALPSPAAYVGAVGSRRRREDRISALEAAGIHPTDAARLRSPVGLDLGARTPWGIAVSVLAEIVATFR